jgi:phospholipase/carboxylesterase
MKVINRFNVLAILFLAAAFGCSCNITQAAGDDPIYRAQWLNEDHSKGSVLILLHGYGSNELDLLGLSPMFPNTGCVITFRAPIRIMDKGFCWFPIEGHSTGTEVDTTAYHEAGDILEEWIDKVVVKEKLQGKKIFVGGFSQGAMMSYEMMRRHANKYAGIIGLSGSVKALNYLDKSSQCAIDMFISHGKQDKVLTYQSGLAVKAKMEECGASIDFFEFGGGHQITKEVMEAANTWLMQRW